MNMLTKLTDKARAPGDPSVLQTGPSSRKPVDNMAQYLGWFSIALGVTELVAARRFTRALGVEGRENIVRAMGAREIAAGITTLSADTKVGMWSRVAGDAVDIGALASAYNDANPKKRNVGLALAAVAGVTMLDIATAQGINARHSRQRGQQRDYRDRSGWPGGIEAARGAAADFRKPDDMRAVPQAAQASPIDGRTSPASARLQETLEPSL